jgi:glutaredoxin
MKKKPYTSKWLCVLISLTGLIITILEIYLTFKGRSLCQTTGCKVVHTFDAYNLLNWIGFGIFSFVFLVFLLDILNFNLGLFLELKTLLLSACVIVEGYFIGFQRWYLHEYCVYCLTVAGLIFLLFIFDFFSREPKRTYPYLVSIMGFSAMFIATFLVNAPLKPLKLKDEPILVYQKGCPHCKHIIEYSKKKGIKMELFEVRNFLSVMRIFNLHQVPLLVYKQNHKIEMLSGEKEILNWLDFKYGLLNIKGHKTKENLFPVYEENGSEEGACEIGKPCE